MGRTRNTAAATETAQNEQNEREMSTDTQEAGTASEAAGSGQEGTITRETIGPEDESGLLGCEDEAELAEGLLVEYVVTAEGGLRLRERPTLDAPVVAVLPCGAGVFGDGEPAPNGWVHVFTGRLSGWMMDKHLEQLGLPAWPSSQSGKLPYAAE